jgi:Trk K+ transport system NAD-binding subunit
VAVGGHTVICGLERISLRVARALIQLGERVTIVAESPEPALLRDARLAGARVMEGRTSGLAEIAHLELESARCLVLTEDGDLRNMHAAFIARERNPGIRVVLRMFNTELADRATRLLSNSRLVSTSAEAAPYFAAAALGMDAAPSRLAWGRHIMLGRSPDGPPTADGGAGPARGTTSLLRGVLARAGRAEPAQPPVEIGDGEFLRPLEPPAPSRTLSRRLPQLRRGLLALYDPRLVVLGAALVALLVVSVVIFHGATGLYPGSGQATVTSWIDALVFAVTTAYGNTNLTGADWWVKLYAVGFMFAEAIALALTLGLVADIAVGASIMDALGVPHGRMRDHVVVLGLGNVGYRTVLHLLDAGVEVAAAHRMAAGRFVAIARRRGVPVLIADAHTLDSLRALSVQHARAVVAATDDDLANLEAALASRELNPSARVITRLYDQELADRAQRQLHITACQSVSALATPAFVAASLGEGVLGTIERDRQLWLLAEAHVHPGSRAAGMTLDVLEASREIRVLAVRDDQREWWRPACPDRLEEGHTVLVACSRAAWERLRAQAAMRMPHGPELSA